MELEHWNQQIFEKWDVKFDILKLRKHVEEFVFPLEAVYQSPSFGGWSVWSSDGSYKDGWHRGYIGLAEKMDRKDLFANTILMGGKRADSYVLPTEICHGYLNEIMNFINDQGLHPCRSRIIRLPAGHSCVWHRDAPSNVYCVRLHVPIFTNQSCYFEVEGDKVHLSADGSAYFLHVNRMHRVVNDGKSDRYHLVMNVRDDRGISNQYKWPPLPQS